MLAGERYVEDVMTLNEVARHLINARNVVELRENMSFENLNDQELCRNLLESLESSLSSIKDHSKRANLLVNRWAETQPTDPDTGYGPPIFSVNERCERLASLLKSNLAFSLNQLKGHSWIVSL